MPKTKHPARGGGRAATLTFEQNQLAILDDYLRSYYPPVGFSSSPRTDAYATVVPRAIQLLDKLRGYERKEKQEAEYANAKSAEAHANAVKGAVARLIGGYQKLSTDDLKKQCAQMLSDDKFWRDLSTLAWSQDEMKKLLGPYAY